MLVFLQDRVAVRNSRNSGLPACSEILPDFEPAKFVDFQQLVCTRTRITTSTAAIFDDAICATGTMISSPRHFQWATKKIPLSLLGLGGATSSQLRLAVLGLKLFLELWTLKKTQLRISIQRMEGAISMDGYQRWTPTLVIGTGNSRVIFGHLDFFV